MRRQRNAAEQAQHRVGHLPARRQAGAALAAAARRELVEDLDQHREADRGVDVALGDVQAEAVDHQHQADHQQEAQAQDDERGALGDECGERLGGDQHGAHRDRSTAAIIT